MSWVLSVQLGWRQPACEKGDAGSTSHLQLGHRRSGCRMVVVGTWQLVGGAGPGSQREVPVGVCTCPTQHNIGIKKPPP